MKRWRSFCRTKKGYVSVITELELLGYQSITSKEHNQIKQFLESCTIIDINEEIKSIYVELRKKYRLKLGDAIAAATALYLDLPFITSDKNFNRIEELQLTQYKPE